MGEGGRRCTKVGSSNRTGSRSNASLGGLTISLAATPPPLYGGRVDDVDEGAGPASSLDDSVDVADVVVGHLRSGEVLVADGEDAKRAVDESTSARRRVG